MPSHRPSSSPIATWVLVGAAAALVAWMMSRRAARAVEGAAGRDTASGIPTGLAAISPAVAAEAEEIPNSDFVRPAGPEAMRDPPRRRWTIEDEASDQSFPASDPPGTY